MRLRTRLLIGYAYLVLLIILAAGGAAVGFFDLSRGIDRVLEENIASLSSATRMLEALERQDSATLAALAQGDMGHKLRNDLNEADASFQEAQRDGAAAAHLDGERQLYRRLEKDYDEYVASRNELLEASADTDLNDYDGQIYPLFERVKGSVFELLEMNRSAAEEAEQKTRQLALYNGVWLGGLVLLALLSLIYLTRGLNERLLTRLADFERLSGAIARGETQTRLPEQGNDELSTVAGYFNAAIDAYEELRGRADGRFAEQRQLVLGLLAAHDHPACLVTLDGRIAASTLDDRGREHVESHTDWVCTEGREQLLGFEPGGDLPRGQVELDEGRRVCFRLLVADQKRPVGWLAWVE